MKKSIDFFYTYGYNNHVTSDRDTTWVDADWCNGSTADSDSVSRGSSPLSVACKTVIKAVLFLCPEYVTVYSCREIFTVVFGEKTLTIKDKKNIIKQYDIRRNSLHQSPGVCWFHIEELKSIIYDN